MNLEAKNQMIAQAVEQIKSGQVIDIIDASGSAFAVCIGDFREIGWADKITTRSSMYWRWTGPTAVRVSGQLVQPGDCTEEIDMDWS